jgi:hypothetical protein
MKKWMAINEGEVGWELIKRLGYIGKRLDRGLNILSLPSLLS